MVSAMAAGGLSVETAFALHQAGRLREAAAIYGQLLKANSRQPAVLHLFGLALHQLGDHAGAERLIRSAIRLAPGVASYHSNLGMVMRALKRPGEAVASFREAVRLSPDHVDALANLGNALSWSTETDAARALLRRACVLAPGHDNATASLGALERTAGNLDRALPAYRRALAIRPFAPAFLSNMGSTLIEVERYDQALGHVVRASLLDPGFAEPWNDLGYLYLMRQKTALSDRYFQAALAIRPQLGSAWAGRAEVAFVADDCAGAVRYSRRAVEIDPTNPQLRFRFGIHLLAHGDLSDGWSQYEAQWQKASAVQRVGAPPRWTGDDLSGRTLLITADQGIGDELLFSSCVPDAARAAADVVLECDQRLVTLFRRSFPGVFVHPYDRAGTRARPVQNYGWMPADRRPDTMIEAGALMRRFRPSLAALDAAGHPWLVPDPARVAAMRRVLDGLGPGLKVGISWRSMRLTAARNPHYPGLLLIDPVLRVPGVTFVCLQYGTGWPEELRATGADMAVVPGLDTTADLEGVTALVSLLDAVICPSSTLGWVGAAVGTPVWLMYNSPVFLEFGTDRLPGFPTVRPYRKPHAGPWEPLVARVAGDLAAWAGQASDTG